MEKGIVQKKVPVSALSPHPQNVNIYGKEDVSWLVERIKESNWIKPLVCTPSLIIVSGNSRWAAAQQLGWIELDVEIDHSLTDELDILERLLDENKNRIKDNLQLIREGQAHRQIIEARNLEKQKDSGVLGKEFGSSGGRPIKSSEQENLDNPLVSTETKGLSEKPEKTKAKRNVKARTNYQVAAKMDNQISANTFSRGDKILTAAGKKLNGYKFKLIEEYIKHSVSGAQSLLDIIDGITDPQADGFVKQLANGRAHSGVMADIKTAIEENKIQNSRYKPEPIKSPAVIAPYDSNMYVKSATKSEARYGDKIFSLSDDKYNTVSTLSRFFHSETGLEFSLREYAGVQTFPADYKFIGNAASIKKQIGNAVAPFMGKYITSRLKGKTVGDLFAGCGGFSCGAHQNGMESKWAVEYAEDAAMSYKLNFPDAIVYNENIKAINPSEFEPVDIILGGPPCQGFSSANHENKKVSASDRFADDPRNELYKEFIRFVDAIRPAEFIMENVPEIQDVKEQIIQDFELIGYKVETMLVIGNEIGMKQNRKRFFFIGEKI
jgi:site-specific DNA-cytosine methylase